MQTWVCVIRPSKYLRCRWQPHEQTLGLHVQIDSGHLSNRRGILLYSLRFLSQTVNEDGKISLSSLDPGAPTSHSASHASPRHDWCFLSLFGLRRVVCSGVSRPVLWSSCASWCCDCPAIHFAGFLKVPRLHIGCLHFSGPGSLPFPSSLPASRVSTSEASVCDRLPGFRVRFAQLLCFNIDWTAAIGYSCCLL